MLFQNKVVIITGSGGGIGKSIALAYAKEGAQVIIAEIDANKGKATTNEITASGGKALFCETDVSKSEHIQRLIDFTVQNCQRIDILVNNAGIGRWVSPYDLSLDDWEKVINTNLRGTFLCSREATKIMRQTGGGSIINIASTRAIMSEPNSEAYAASKGGILSLTHALAASLAPDRIQVNCISPGWIETGDYQNLKQSDHAQHFSGRVGKPEDIATACLYLSRPGNNFINGANLVIDGGMTRKMIYEE